MKVNKVHILLSCVPVMRACAEIHDLVWLFSFLYSWSAYLHLFSYMENVNSYYVDMI
jgi:hypothetical protein